MAKRTSKTDSYAAMYANTAYIPATVGVGSKSGSKSAKSGKSGAQSAGSQATASNSASRKKVKSGSRASAGAELTPQERRKRAVKRALLGLLIALLVVVLGFAVYVMVFATQLGKEFGLANSNLSQEDQMAITEILEPAEDILQPFYMLLLGTDSRLLDVNDTGRSDTAIIVRVDPQTYTVSMISIPRDSRVDIPGYWTTKFNAAYSYGGVPLALQTANDVTGIGLQHFALVNFQTLVDLVDDIGGIDVYVPVEVDDVKAGSTYIPAGWNHIDGEQALMLARTRDWKGSDFTRQAFQRQIIQAIINQVLSLPPTELTSCVKRAAGSILTDMSIEDLFQLALHFKDHTEEMTFYSANLPSYTQTIDGISYVILVDQDVDQMIQLFIKGEAPTAFEPTYGGEYIVNPLGF